MEGKPCKPLWVHHIQSTLGGMMGPPTTQVKQWELQWRMPMRVRLCSHLHVCADCIRQGMS